MKSLQKIFALIGLLFLFVRILRASDGWQNPGCHKIGHTRKISIKDCVEFKMTTNACRGFCESWSVPSSFESLALNPLQSITSKGRCCNIMESEDMNVRVMCLNGIRDLVFKSAVSCSCFHCKKQ